MVRRAALVIDARHARPRPGRRRLGTHARSSGVTANRSLEAHLADHGLQRAARRRTAGAGPGRARPTRSTRTSTCCASTGWPAAGACRSGRGRPSPTTGRSTARPSVLQRRPPRRRRARASRPAVRRAGRVPAAPEVVNVYGNSDAGDVSAGLDALRARPWREEVGRREAARDAARLAPRPGAALDPPAAARAALDARLLLRPGHARSGRSPTTRCFGAVLPDRLRGGPRPAVRRDRRHLRGPPARRAARARRASRSRRAATTTARSSRRPCRSPPRAIGDRLVVTVPGEVTAELGRRTRAAVLAAARGAGIRRVVLAGYANEYASYFTTPEEYDAQHYEGGTTVYGPRERAVPDRVARRPGAAAGRAASRRPRRTRSTRRAGCGRRRARYPSGRARAVACWPSRARPRGSGTPSSAGAAARPGTDRPLDRPFVSGPAPRRRAAGERSTTDLGLSILWRVDDARPKLEGIPRFRGGETGTYTAAWEPPASAPAGRYRFVVTRAPVPAGLAARSGSAPSRALRARARSAASTPTSSCCCPIPPRSPSATSRPGRRACGAAARSCGWSGRRFDGRDPQRTRHARRRPAAPP